ncbi:MAG: hypothetical protein HOF22_06395 [Verrucomicrobia bacterium]|nr:hypothetical protein [Verrucomicrobiota bacterium]
MAKPCRRRVATSAFAQGDNREKTQPFRNGPQNKQKNINFLWCFGSSLIRFPASLCPRLLEPADLRQKSEAETYLKKWQ